MRRKIVLNALATLGCLSLVACGGKDEGGNKVQMKDMEVVDGTATDAMTDLDGVQSEGGALAMPDNGTNASAAAPAPKEKAAAADAEVLSDQ
jgi:hypothetical protein